MIKKMRFPKLSPKIIGFAVLAGLIGIGVRLWFNTSSQATVLNDKTGDVANPSGTKAAIDFIDLKSLSIKVDGQNLVLRYQLKDPLSKDASILPEVSGARIATLQIWTNLHNDKIPGKLAMLINRWGTNGRVFSSNFEYGMGPTPERGHGSYQIKKTTNLRAGGLGYDYFEVAYPLSDLNLARGDEVRIRVFATVINSNNQFISEDIIADEDFAIEGDLVTQALMMFKLGSSTPPYR